MGIIQNLLFILFLPLIGSLLIILSGDKRTKYSPLIASLVSFLLLINSILLLCNFGDMSFEHSWEWIKLGSNSFFIGLLFDNITATMLCMISLVGFFIFTFSLQYMKGDSGEGRYFSGISFFMFSMLGIILANNLIMVFVFWELVGFSSYILIGHYFKKEEARLASQKAFIANRVGDFGFLLGIILTYNYFGTTNFNELARILDSGTELDSQLTFIGFLLICGFIGKSAQFPLHIWLPDAMAGPTPVSALIHAATMVAAGIYLLIRIDFFLDPLILSFITYLGVFVALFAGFSAFAQKDIKRILAFSTLSQLGYMAAIFGMGFSGIALFHLITHAFFKALLFLGAGSIIYACHHEQSIFKMGGLIKKMPITSITFIIGTLALCGVYGFSGFYSKDSILIGAASVSPNLFYLLTFGAFLTSGYMFRLVFIVFLGNSNSEKSSNAKENSLLILLPLIGLALFSISSGWIDFWPLSLGELIKADLEKMHYIENYKIIHEKAILLGTLSCVLGGIFAFLFYGKGSNKDKLKLLYPQLYKFFKMRLWVDEIYSFYINNVQKKVANLLSFIDEFFLRGLCVRGLSSLIGVFGFLIRHLHVGKLNNYYLWFFLGVIIVWVYSFN